MSGTPKITVSSWVDPRFGTIGVDTVSTFDSMTNQIYRQVMQTQEKCIRDGLIALGWTPPSAKPVNDIGESDETIV